MTQSTYWNHRERERNEPPLHSLRFLSINNSWIMKHENIQLKLLPHRLSDSRRSHHCTGNTAERAEWWKPQSGSCVSVHMCVSCGTENTHIYPQRCVDESGHPVAFVQHRADHWDETQKPDILHHLGPLRQLYSLNLENPNLATDQRRPDNLMCGLCVFVCMCQGEGENRQTRSSRLWIRARECVRNNRGNRFKAIGLQMYVCVYVLVS